MNNLKSLEFKAISSIVFMIAWPLGSLVESATAQDTKATIGPAGDLAVERADRKQRRGPSGRATVDP